MNSDCDINLSLQLTPIQSGAIITRPNITWYCIYHCNASGIIKIRVWIHKIHLIFCPIGQAMGCLLWGFWRKLTMLQQHHTVQLTARSPNQFTTPKGCGEHPMSTAIRCRHDKQRQPVWANQAPRWLSWQTDYLIVVYHVGSEPCLNRKTSFLSRYSGFHFLYL